MSKLERVGYAFNLDNVYVCETLEIAPTGYTEVPKPQMVTWVKPPKHTIGEQEAVYNRGSDSWTVRDIFVKVDAYKKEDRSKKTFEDKSLVTEDYTLLKPDTNFDIWDGEEWVLDEVAKYHHDYQEVNSIREILFTQQTDPLVNEVKKLEILEDEDNKAEIDLLKSRIKELNTKIKEENPWPVKPEGVL